MALSLGLEVGEGHAQVLAITVDELHAGTRVERGQRGGHEGVGRAEDGFPSDACEIERREGPAGPARAGHGRDVVPGCPRCLEALRDLSFGPAARVEYAVDELVHPGAVALIEADRESRIVGGAWAREIRGAWIGSGGHVLCATLAALGCSVWHGSRPAGSQAPRASTSQAPSARVKALRRVGRYRVLVVSALRSPSGAPSRCVDGSPANCRSPHRAGGLRRHRRGCPWRARRSAAEW